MTAPVRSRLLLLALTLAAYLAGLAVPYRVETDTAFQLKSVQQWVRGESPTPATLRFPEPGDLGHDGLLWTNWWPPGFPVLYAPLAALGLSLAVDLRVTSLILFLVGAAGWLSLVDRLSPPAWVRHLFVAGLAAHAVTLGGAASLRTADVLTWAAGPWLLALALRAGEAELAAPWLFASGLLLGGSYWLRYSLFLTAVSLCAWMALRLLRRSGPNSLGGAVRLGRMTALGIGFALPVAALFLINLRTAPTLTEGVSGTRSAWVVDDVRFTRSPRLAASLAGAPGLSLFQADLPLTHLTFFSDSRLPFLRGWTTADRLLLKSLLGIPGTVALLWGLLRLRRRRPGPLPDLTLFVTAAFYLEMTAVSLVVGYNYLANEPRLATGFLPAASLLALAGWVPIEAGRRARSGAALLMAVFVAVPVAFAAANFARNDLWDRWKTHYQPSETGLYMPELSPRNVPEIRAAVAAALRSSGDVVVLAGPAGYGSSFVMWLELPQRALPAGTYVAPLGARYTDALDLRGSRKLVSLRPLRVVLVVAKSLVQDGWLPRIQARLPQARAWQTAPTPADAAVEIWWSDLAPPSGD